MHLTSNAPVKQPVKGLAKHVPVVMQMEALECGAACLAMVMAYYQKWVPLEQAREDCGVSRDGSKAANILKAARSYGFEAQGFRLEPQDLRDEGEFPCIVHWEFNHFIVVNGFRNGKVYVNDPARGNYTMTEEAFDKGFTGICLMFEPGESFKPSGQKKSVLEFAAKRMQGTGSAVLFVVLTTCIASVSAIISTGFSRIFMDQLLTGRDSHYLISFIVAISFFSFIQIVAAWIQAIYTYRINGKLAVVGNTSYFWHVLRLPMKFFSQRMAGDIEQRRETNASIASSLVNTLAPLFLNTIMMFFYLVVMIRYSLLLTTVGLTSVLTNIVVSRIVSSKRVNVTRVMMRDQGKLYSATVSGIDMIETIKASGAENGYFRKWAGYQASVNAQQVRFTKLNAYLGIIPGLVGVLVNNIVLIMGVFLVMRGQFTPGMVLAFQGFLSRFLMPAQSLISAGQTIQEMRTQMERIEDVMSYKAVIPAQEETETTAADGSDEQPAAEKESERKLSGSVSMRHVTFGYSSLAEPLIEDFNMELKQGQSVAFVGASGCGKSTLSKLLSGLYSPWSGEIVFDDRPMEQIDRSVFTASVAVVDQDIILFEDTIANNIKMWDNSIEDFEMILAARDAQLHEDIMQRDGGYQYKLTEGGRDFSGGQRQRMEIARVLAQDPTLIIMDEATSALDAKTEYEVVRSIRDRGITCVVIAHRLSTIRDCDEIIVLDHGKVMERGTHDELIKKKGLYMELVTAE
ncbi:MAG: NHLP family bacteriocin export ABC transporter peptidase/permease/ATPase subunit [Lachnospiraceae bacterium]|nr:NHLP family bacteriocin export ABC transporter peptidase/permease/ATPase subunit [Lachnospiraceae bacterium]